MATPVVKADPKALVDVQPDPKGKKGKKGKGLGKSGVRSKFTDAKKALLTIQMRRSGDGFQVRGIHVEKEGAEPKTWDVDAYVKEEDAKKAYDNLCALVLKGGWKPIASAPKVVKKEFTINADGSIKFAPVAAKA